MDLHLDLPALVDFNLVARYGGVGRAARASGRPKATLSRNVAVLEAGLGLRLFERGARALVLTEEGKALFERTSVLLAEIDETAGAIAQGGATARGRLRISAPLLFSQAAMGKLAAGFAVMHPAVRLEVTTEDRPVEMVEEGYDLVIRVNPAPDATLVGRVLMRDRLVVVAAPGLARPDSSRPDGALVPVVIRGTRAERAAWPLLTAAGKTVIEVEPVLSLSSLFMVRDAVRRGVGAAQLPLSLALRDLAAGTLVKWGDIDSPEIALWALYPSRRLLSARVSAFLAYLKEAFPNGTPEELSAYMDS